MELAPRQQFPSRSLGPRVAGQDVLLAPSLELDSPLARHVPGGADGRGLAAWRYDPTGRGAPVLRWRADRAGPAPRRGRHRSPRRDRRRLVLVSLDLAVMLVFLTVRP